jgi:N-acetylglucosaminyl-diphospho-decaprenol L-rhamnosyltransferase
MVPVVTVVVSWNTRTLLDDCLRSLQADAQRGLTEVWVVDNGSTDGSVELVREHHPWARLIVAGTNLGYGPAVNLVVERTSSRWIVAANADTRVTPGALEALVSAGEADRRAAIVGPRLVLPDGSTQLSLQRFPTVHDALLWGVLISPRGQRIGRRLGLPGYWDPARPAVVDWLAGALLLIRRSAWDQIGGFAPDQWMYAEDLDLCWRASRRGWRVRYEPAAVVHHEHSVAAAQAFGDEEARTVRMLSATYTWLVRRRGRARALIVVATQLGALSARALAGAALRVLDPDRPHGSGRLSASALRLHWRSARAVLR